MKPEFMLINWSKGAVIGCGSEKEVREQMDKALKGNNYLDSFIIAEVKVLSEMKRVES